MDLPPEVAAVVERLLRKHHAERYSSGEAVIEALEAHAVARGSSTVSSASSKPLTSIAVLPFVFLSDVEGSRALSLGFADAIITILGNSEDVVVTPTSAILSYAAGAEPGRVCRDLGVRHALQGTVQKLGAHWRVSMQLFDVTTQKVTLAEKHDFDLDDVFEVQDELDGGSLNRCTVDFRRLCRSRATDTAATPTRTTNSWQACARAPPISWKRCGAPPNICPAP
jgi:adenylate cyclase